MRQEDPEKLVKRVAARIATLRREKDLTQEEMAKKLGTATKNYQRIEYGQNITIHTLGRIAAALGVRASELVEEPPKPPAK